MKRVAVMQPYFMPYLGYFRLFKAVDHFLFLDCVQFPRRGWVHRNRLVLHGPGRQWLTLPLAKQPQNTLIKDLAFHPDARSLWEAQLASFPWLQSPPDQVIDLLTSVQAVQSNTPVSPYLIDTLIKAGQNLRATCKISKTSDLNLPPSLKGQDRIIAAVQAVGGGEYINPPGGVQLYDAEEFRRHDIALRFIAPYQGDMRSILARAYEESWDQLASELDYTAVFHNRSGTD